jgi:hypothetical protein
VSINSREIPPRLLMAVPLRSSCVASITHTVHQRTTCR